MTFRRTIFLVDRLIESTRIVRVAARRDLAERLPLDRADSIAVAVDRTRRRAIRRRMAFRDRITGDKVGMGTPASDLSAQHRPAFTCASRASSLSSAIRSF